MTSDALREIDHLPGHPRWCHGTSACRDFTPGPHMLAEHVSDVATFRPQGDDVIVSVGTARVDTGYTKDDDLTVELGHTEVRLVLRDAAFRCDCGSPREVAVRLDFDEVKQLVNLLSVHSDLASARQLLDIEKYPL